jgi:Mycothiol maleylpyruvate isomerase N-terminal domain
MNARDVLRYGHLTVLGTLEGLNVAHADTPGVCGVWSVKDIVAHLASFELMLEDVLKSMSGERVTPTLDAYRGESRQFNDTQVARRKGKSYVDVVAEYTLAHGRVAALAGEMPQDLFPHVNTIPWYGPEYSLDDFIVYTNYAHKREHCAQIKVFRKRSENSVP